MMGIFPWRFLCVDPGVGICKLNQTHPGVASADITESPGIQVTFVEAEKKAQITADTPQKRHC